MYRRRHLANRGFRLDQGCDHKGVPEQNDAMPELKQPSLAEDVDEYDSYRFKDENPRDENPPDEYPPSERS